MLRLGETESLCPVCLKKIPAKRVVDNGDVYLEKHCPLHGDFRTIIWRDARFYSSWDGCGMPGRAPAFLGSTEKGCPFDCGLCPEHEQDTCTVLMEVTDRCNIHCPVCFAGSTSVDDTHPTLSEIDGLLDTIIASGGPYPIQISGGEPTVRDDLPEIIDRAKKRGFDHIQINTNGIRFAQDIDFLKKAKDHGATELFLQFDGVDDSVYRTIRGVDLFEIKKKLIKNCNDVKIAVVLVPTIIPGVNLNQLGKIIQFAKEMVSVVKGVHFQPVSYFGRFRDLDNNPDGPSDDERATIPDLLGEIERQTGGEVRIKDFVPPT
ncbi:MAG: radical SAM protein [Thermodesulfobacteriota bacterium]|nr:radical SAM protein [Thermodesulfobacteriota bacterium]